MYSGKFVELVFFSVLQFSNCWRIEGKKATQQSLFPSSQQQWTMFKGGGSVGGMRSIENYLVLQLKPELFAIALYRIQENHFNFCKKQNC